MLFEVSLFITLWFVLIVRQFIPCPLMSSWWRVSWKEVRSEHVCLTWRVCSSDFSFLLSLSCHHILKEILLSYVTLFSSISWLYEQECSVYPDLVINALCFLTFHFVLSSSMNRISTEEEDSSVKWCSSSSLSTAFLLLSVILLSEVATIFWWVLKCVGSLLTFSSLSS